MKLKLENRKVRLRLTRAEIAELAEKGRIEAHTPLSPGQTLHYGVEAAEVSGLSLAWADNSLIMRLPLEAAKAWPTSGQVGWSREVPAGEGELLQLYLEWDLKEGRRPAPESAREERSEENEPAGRFEDLFAGREARDEPSD